MRKNLKYAIKTENNILCYGCNNYFNPEDSKRYGIIVYTTSRGLNLMENVVRTHPAQSCQTKAREKIESEFSEILERVVESRNIPYLKLVG
jgi:hypothetical protein